MISEHGAVPWCSVLVLTEKLGRHLSDEIPGRANVPGLGGASAHGQAQHELTRQLARHQVDPATDVDSLQQGFVQVVGRLSGTQEND